jgi:hypothetical protein
MNLGVQVGPGHRKTKSFLSQIVLHTEPIVHRKLFDDAYRNVFKKPMWDEKAM